MTSLSDLISSLRISASFFSPGLKSSDERVNLPICETIAFSDCNGIYQERIKKKQLRMVRDYVPLLKQFMEPGEEIVLVMRACSPAAFWHEAMTQMDGLLSSPVHPGCHRSQDTPLPFKNEL